MKNKYVIGLDCGTLSARAVVVSCEDGSVMGEHVFEYPHGVMSAALPDGTVLPDGYALAYAQDYRDALFESIKAAVCKAKVNTDDIIAIGIDTTSYTMVPCLRDGTVIHELEGFSSRPMAYIKLWKHLGAAEQAGRIKTLYDRGVGFASLRAYGGACNCEFAVPKLLETWEKDRQVWDIADWFCDFGEWLALLLTGKQVHGLYNAGFKCMWREDTGWPSRDELNALSPGFGEAFHEKFAGEVSEYGAPCGFLTADAANKLGLPVGIPVAVPTGDAAPPGLYCCIPDEKAVTISVGTSIGMSFTADEKKEITGINGVTYGGIVPGRWSYDAGTPCAGDMLEWFCKYMVSQKTATAAAAEKKNIHDYLASLTEAEPWANTLTVLDWWNGNKGILNNMSLRGNILGLSLATTTADLYCAFVQAIACSIRTILSHLDENGIPLETIVLCGGIPQKNRFLVEQIASITGRTVRIPMETQLTAIGSAILAAMAAGMDMTEAARKISSKGFRSVEPDIEHKGAYETLYRRWKNYHDLLGNVQFS